MTVENFMSFLTPSLKAGPTRSGLPVVCVLANENVAGGLSGIIDHGIQIEDHS